MSRGFEDLAGVRREIPSTSELIQMLIKRETMK